MLSSAVATAADDLQLLSFEREDIERTVLAVGSLLAACGARSGLLGYGSVGAGLLFTCPRLLYGGAPLTTLELVATFARMQRPSSIMSFCIVLLATGCVAPYALRPGTVAPVTATVPPEQRTMVWQHAIAVLLDEGYVPQVLNESACFVSAKQRDDVVAGTTGTIGATVVVTVSPEGIVRVQVSGNGIYHC